MNQKTTMLFYWKNILRLKWMPLWTSKFSNIFLILSGFILFHTPTDAQTLNETFSVIAYLPEYRLSSLQPNQLKVVTELVYFGIKPSDDGGLPKDVIHPETLKQLHQLQETSGCSMLLTVGGWGRSEHFPALASNETARKRFIKSLKNLCISHSFSGVDFDWEHPKNEREIKDYATLLKETQSSFQSQGLKVTVAQAAWQDLGREAYDAVDRVHLMTYDHDYPQATVEKSIADVKRLIQFGCSPEKIAFGLPFYGRNKSRDAKTYRELIADSKFDPTVNEINGYAFNGRQTITQKINFALQYKLHGIMIWEIGQDSLDPQSSLLQGIQTQIKSTSIPKPINGPVLQE